MNKNNDEIVTDVRIINNISLTVPENKKTLNIVSRIVVAFLGLFGTIFSFFSMFNINISIIPVIISALLSFGIFSVLFLMPRRFHKIAFIFIALWSAMLYFCRKKYANGFKMIFNRVYENLFPNSSDYFSVKNKIPEDIEFFLVLTVFLLGLLICYFVYAEPSFTIGFILTFGFVEIGIYHGKSPNLIFMFMLIIYWLSLMSLKFCGFFQRLSRQSNGFIRRDNSFTAKPGIKFYISGMSVIVVGIICILIFTLTAIISNLSGYTRSENINLMRSNIKYASDEFKFDNLGESLQRFSDSLGFDKLKSYNHKLGDVGKINFKNSCQLTIETDDALNSNLYLKGYTGTVYSDNEWLDFEDDIYNDYEEMFDDFYDTKTFPQDMLTNYFFNRYDLYYANMRVTSEYNNEKYNYIPYIAVPDGKITYTGDTQTTLENMKSYTFKVNKLQITKSNFSDVLSGMDYSINDGFDEYTEFVYDNYCSYENTDALNEVYKKFVRGSVLESDADIYQKLNYIKELLGDNASYTLNPGKTPGNRDFVNYFLLENHKGFCVHYATAGVVLARMSGIPARYCDGYVLLAEDFNSKNRMNDGSYKIEIDDTHGHAWAEIYIENLGWIPYEFTGSGPALGEESTEPTTQSTTTKKHTTKISSSKISKSSVSRSASKTEITINKTTTKVLSKEHKNISMTAKMVIIAVLFLIALIGIFILRFVMTVKRKEKNLCLSDTVSSVTFAYSYLLKIFSFCGIEKNNMHYLEFAEHIHKKLPDIADSDFETVTQIMLKAQLSQETSDESEAKYVVDYYKKIYDKVYAKSNILKKFEMKFIKIL